MHLFFFHFDLISSSGDCLGEQMHYKREHHSLRQVPENLRENTGGKIARYAHLSLSTYKSKKLIFPFQSNFFLECLPWWTDALQAGASQFEATSGKLKSKYWWKNMKVCTSLSFMLCFIIYIHVWFSSCSFSLSALANWTSILFVV